jgi:hypothetical protein
MFREFDPQRPPLPLLQIERTTIGDVTPLFCFEPAGHARVMYHEDMLGIEHERADVHVSCTDQANVIVDRQELGMEKALSMQVDFDPGLETLLIVRPLGPRHENLVPCFGKYDVDIHAAKHSGLQGLRHRFVRYKIRHGDLDLFASSVEQGNDETLVVLGRKIRSTRQGLDGNRPSDFRISRARMAS